jgi:hypothetical protein
MYVALGLVGAILAFAVWLAAVRDGLPAAAARRRDLESRREEGLEALAALERERAAQAIDQARYERRRAALLSRLERVYGELDGEGGPVAG